MNHTLLDIETIEQQPDGYLRAIGHVFAIFDEHTQDSGNVSYGVEIDQQRFFVKTAGDPTDPRPYLPHIQRVDLLRNAALLRRNCAHIALPHLYNIIESPHGPMLVYEWADGELLRVPSAMRDDPESSHQRFRRLPVTEILSVLNLIYDLHVELAAKGWIAVDFYDGCLIYDFDRQTLRIVDLDMYRDAPFTNEMGRMFGSSRFMAPEEFATGAEINEQTTVFTMGRTAFVLLGDGTMVRAAFRGNDALYEVCCRACHDDRSQRCSSMAEFYAAWRAALQ